MLLALAAVLLALAHSCQEMRLVAKDGSVVVGKTMDSDYKPSVEYILVMEPKGIRHQFEKLPNCPAPFRFKSRYKIATFRSKDSGVLQNAVKGGMNDVGLAASMPSFAHYAHFIDKKLVEKRACRKAVPQTALVTYVLSTYKDVAKIIKDLKKDKFPTVWNDGDKTAHYSFTDKTGRGVVLEYTEELGRRYHENTVGVLTNGPDYQWHMTNLRNYPWLRAKDWAGFSYADNKGKKIYTQETFWTGSGTSGLPGGYTSPDRFVKAAVLLNQVETPKDANGAVVSMFHLLNAAEIPRGVVTRKDGTPHYTVGASVKDLSRGCLYYRARTDLSVKRVCLRNIPDLPAFVNVEGEFEDGITDTKLL